MMDGQMLHLSDKLMGAFSCASPKTKLSIGQKTLCLYFGEASAKLRDHGLLNIILWDGDTALGLGVAELEGFHKEVKYQEQMKKLNSSEIIGVSQVGDKIYLQHWDGFKTEMDAFNMEIIGQKFTK